MLCNNILHRANRICILILLYESSSAKITALLECMAGNSLSIELLSIRRCNKNIQIQNKTERQESFIRLCFSIYLKQNQNYRMRCYLIRPEAILANTTVNITVGNCILTCSYD